MLEWKVLEVIITVKLLPLKTYQNFNIFHKQVSIIDMIYRDSLTKMLVSKGCGALV
jgi:hypothetical protein